MGRASRFAKPYFDALEERGLLSVAVPGITATEGFPFNGEVATFTSADVQGTSFQATISWGDGQVTSGTVMPDAGGFAVIGSKTYAVPGTYPMIVTVTGDPGSSSTGEGSAMVSPVSPVATGTTIAAVAGEPFTGPVALFFDTYPGLTAAAYTATIDWGDGTISASTIQPNTLGGYDVIGTKVYDAPSMSRTVTVTVVRTFDGQKATASGAAIAVNQTNLLTGRLAPATDTGAVDGVTSINQPTFIGTASPYSIVAVFARRSDQAQPVLLGRAIADAGGAWTLTVGALPDGVYDMSASETPTAGLPGPLVPLVPVGTLVIDTVPPVGLSAHFDANSGQVTVVLRDNLSGLDPASLLTRTNYALKVGGRFRAYPAAVTTVPTAPVVPSDPVAVALRFEGLARLLAGRRGAAIALGLITDVAGNPLATRHLSITPSVPVRTQALRNLRRR
jgi:Bacterial Ig-like domain